MGGQPLSVIGAVPSDERPATEAGWARACLTDGVDTLAAQLLIDRAPGSCGSPRSSRKRSATTPSHCWPPATSSAPCRSTHQVHHCGVTAAPGDDKVVTPALLCLPVSPVLGSLAGSVTTAHVRQRCRGCRCRAQSTVVPANSDTFTWESALVRLAGPRCDVPVSHPLESDD